VEQGYGAITNHAAVVAGDITGIRVFEDFGSIGAEALGRHHGGDDGTSATRFPDAPFEVLRQTEVIPFRDGFQSFVVHG